MNAAEHDRGASLSKEPGRLIGSDRDGRGDREEDQIVGAVKLERADQFVLNLDLPRVAGKMM
jgi:hypothetical protein